MSREQTYHAIILKKQPYREADEIITFFTKEQGKIRGLAKSVKSPKSKLQQKLQALFYVQIRLTLGKMPKIISAETLKVYHRLRENLAAMKIAFYATEVVLKITPDEQKNEALFNLLEGFLEFLDTQTESEILDLGLAKFKIEILEVSGLGMQNVKDDLFNQLKKTSFEGLESITETLSLDSLQTTLSKFIEYQLERKISSEKYLRGNMV